MMPNKMPISIMDEKSEMLIKETPIRLSDQALNTIQLHTYEKAVKNVTKWHFYKLYAPFLSVAGTLAFSVFTSTFNSIGSLSSDDVKKYVILGAIILGAAGLICLFIAINKRITANTDERDQAIKEIQNQYLKDTN